MENQTKIWTKSMKIFVAVAFALPYLLGILMGIGYSRGTDLSLFPNAQMMYPAAGVILAVLLTRRGDTTVPRRFYISYLIFTVSMIVMTLASVIMPSQIWPVALNLVIIAGSLISGILLLTEKQEKRLAWGLLGGKRGMSTLMVLLFLALYLGRTVFGYAISVQLETMAQIFSNPLILMTAAMLPVNFFFVYIAFFGEEYGWRYYFQPMLQKRFGMIKGVLFLGVLWGFWHLPINLFYYATPADGLISVAGQQVACITLGVFFAYAYMKTQNIWVPVIMHYLNNNLVPIITGNLSATVLENQEVSWISVAASLVINGVIFLGFLGTKYFRSEAYRTRVMNEDGIGLLDVLEDEVAASVQDEKSQHEEA